MSKVWKDSTHKDVGLRCYADDVVVTEEEVDSMTERLTKIGDTSWEEEDMNINNNNNNNNNK